MRSPRPDLRNGWLALPGLFDAYEVVDAQGLDVWAEPLVQIESRVLFGIYVREAETMVGRPVTDASRSGIRPSLAPPPPVARPRTRSVA